MKGLRENNIKSGSRKVLHFALWLYTIPPLTLFELYDSSLFFPIPFAVCLYLPGIFIGKKINRNLIPSTDSIAKVSETVNDIVLLGYAGILFSIVTCLWFWILRAL